MGRKGISKGKIITIIIFAVLLLDQAFKIWIKTHFTLHQSVNVLGNWFQLCFVENEGMAFGMVLGGDFGKLFLSLFRIVLSAGIIFFVWGVGYKLAFWGQHDPNTIYASANDVILPNLALGTGVLIAGWVYIRYLKR